MAGHKAPQAAAQPILLIGDDGSMRNGQAKWAAKQRRDREPIRKPTDQPGLGCGLQHLGPIARRQLVAEQNKRGHGDQQTGRKGTMALERQAKRGIRVMFRHGAWIAQKPHIGEASEPT